MAGGPIDDEVRQLLAVDWAWALLHERVGVVSFGGLAGNWNAQTVDGRVVVATLEGSPLALHLSGPGDLSLEDIEREAMARAANLDFGRGVWWQTTFQTTMTSGDPLFMLHMNRLMREFNRFDGAFSIGRTIRVTFENSAPAGLLPVPSFTAKVVFFSPGPSYGPLSSRTADRMIVLIRAAGAWATGCPWKGAISNFMVDPADVEAVDLELTTGALRAFPVPPAFVEPVLDEVMDTPDFEAITRLHSALIACEEALNQESPFVALIMFVTVLEALATPNTGWQTDRLSARFVDFVDRLVPTSLDQIIGHGQFDLLFGGRRSRREFLENLYRRRSRPLHTGRLGRSVAFFDMSSRARIETLSTLCREAIAVFLVRPRSSLIGHPSISPAQRPTPKRVPPLPFPVQAITYLD